MVQINTKIPSENGPNTKRVHSVSIRSVTNYARGLVILLLLTSEAGAGTALEIKMTGCRRGVDKVVVCDFSFKSDASGSNTLTGGQYSQALDKFGTIYDATKVQIEDRSAMAVFVEFESGTNYFGKLYFDGVDDSSDLFKLVTMRFADGEWQQSNVVIEK